MTQAGRRRRDNPRRRKSATKTAPSGVTRQDLKTVEDKLQKVKGDVDELKSGANKDTADLKKSLDNMETKFEDELGKMKSAISKEMTELKSHVNQELKKAKEKKTDNSANDNDSPNSNADD